MFGERWGRGAIAASAVGVAAALLVGASLAAGQALLVTLWSVSAGLLTAVLPELLRWVWGRGSGVGGGPYRAQRPAVSDREGLEDAALLLGDRVLHRVLTSSVRMSAAVPMQLRVRFRSAAGLRADRAVVVQQVGGTWAEQPLEGDVGQIAQRLRELPLRQLVVIGEPGAGKSVLGLLLTQQLLQTRLPDEPVPVLIAVSSWDPSAQSVAEFVTRRLVTDFAVSKLIATQLMGQARQGVGHLPWRLMPILDGLDELPAEQHEAALGQLEEFAAQQRPVVVMCRTREWLRAEAQAGPLSRAAVVALQSLRPEDVIGFLAHSTTRQRLWEPVFAQLRQPQSMLAEVLSTPLMASLARDVFAVAGDPGELVRRQTRQALTARLIDGYFDVVYRRSRWAPIRIGKRRFRTAVGDPARWLSNLAYLAYEDGTRDLRWWRLPWQLLLSRPNGGRRTAWTLIVAGVAGLAAGIGAIAGGWSATLLVSGCWAALISGCLAGLWVPVFGHDLHPVPPWWLRRLVNSRIAIVRATARFGLRLLFGLLCGVVVGVVVGRPLIGAVGGMATAVAVPVVPGRQRWRCRWCLVGSGGR